MTRGWIPDCAACRHARRCAEGTGTCDVSRAPAGRAALEAYTDPAVLELSREAACIEARGYRVWDRARETIELARRMGYRRLGLAFCISLAPETEAFARRLQDESFEVVSVLDRKSVV